MMVAPSLHFHSIREQTLFEIGVVDIPLPSRDHPVYGKHLFGRLSEGGNVTDLAFGLTRQSNVMTREYEGAIVHETDARLRLKGERVSNQDGRLAGHWAKRIKESDFHDRWDRTRDPIHMMFESQTMHEGDRHWQRYSLIANGFETTE